MNPEEIKRIQALVLQHRWMNQTRFQEALGRYRSLPSPPHLLEALLKWGYLSQDQCLKIHPLLLGPPTQSASGSPPFVLPPLRGNYQKYQILKELGRGGMGRVCLARDLDLKRMVAIKVCQKISPQDLLRLVREAQIGSQLEHPGIAPLYDAGRTPEGNVYFAMKYIEGIPLSEAIGQLANKNPTFLEQYPLRRRLTLFGKILEGMSYVHSRGVVHRDLKPDNIMLGPFGEVLIVDWGLAKNFKDTEEEQRSDQKEKNLKVLKSQVVARTLAGAIVGTPGYMPPEQAWGDHEKLSPQSDIYSLGLILYELLTLKKAFEGREIIDVLMRTVEGNYLSPREAAPEKKVPKALEAIVLKAMALEAQARYNHCGETLEDLQAFLDDQPISVYTPPFWEKAMSFVRKRAEALLVLCMVSLFLAGLFYSLNAAEEAQRRSAEAEKEKAQAARKKAEAEKETLRAEKATAEAEKNATITFQERRNRAMPFFLVARNHLSGVIKFPHLKEVVIPNLKKALSMDPSFLEARVDLIKVLFFLEKKTAAFGEVMDLFHRLPKKDKKKLGSHFLTIILSLSNREKGANFSTKLPPFEELRKVKPQFLIMEYWEALIAYLYKEMGHYDQALKIVDQVLSKKEGRNWEIYYLKSLILSSQKQYEQVKKFIEERVRENPGLALYYIVKASALIKQGRFNSAQRNYTKAFKIDPECHILLNSLANFSNLQAKKYKKRSPTFYLAYSLAACRYRQKTFEIEGNLPFEQFRDDLRCIAKAWTNRKNWLNRMYTKETIDWLYEEMGKSKNPDILKEFCLFLWKLYQIPQEKLWLQYLQKNIGFSTDHFQALGQYVRRYFPFIKNTFAAHQETISQSIDWPEIQEVLKKVEEELKKK